MEKLKRPSEQLLLILLSIYELIRACAIIGIPSFLGGWKSASELPAAFFYAVPLLILPFIIVVAELFGLKKLAQCKYLFPIIKLASSISYISFFILNFKEAAKQLRLDNFNPLYSLILLMIFFIIDVIIGVTTFNRQKNLEIKKDE